MSRLLDEKKGRSNKVPTKFYVIALTASMKKSDMGMVTSADEVSRRMREKYGI
jgi:hypothetical protein